MFENIYGQEKVISLLSNDITRKSLSNSMIFYGQKYTGKLSCALETVRVLNCQNDGNINCQCKNCQSIRNLSFDGMVFFSRRNFSYYIRAFIESFSHSYDMDYFDKIIYYIKLIFLSLNDTFVQGVISESDLSSIHKMQESIYSIVEDNYDSYRSIKTLSQDIRQKMLDELNKIAEYSDEIFAMYKKPSVPVDMIRNALDWSYINQPNVNRVIIIDKADFLDDSSRNVLLKRLEEPSPNLFFILLAENKNRIIQTILSRCRAYFFQEHSEQSTSVVLQNVFGVNQTYCNVNQFLLKDDKTAFQNMINDMIKVLNYIFNIHHTFNELESFLEANNDKNYAKALMQNLSILVDEEILARSCDKQTEINIDVLKSLSIEDLQTFKRLLDQTVIKMEIYNLTPVWTMEGLFFPIKSMVTKGKIKC